MTAPDLMRHTTNTHTQSEASVAYKNLIQDAVYRDT